MTIKIDWKERIRIQAKVKVMRKNQGVVGKHLLSLGGSVPKLDLVLGVAVIRL